MRAPAPRVIVAGMEREECTSCGATLGVTDADVVTCTYCGAVYRREVPEQASEERPARPPTWLYGVLVVGVAGAVASVSFPERTTTMVVDGFHGKAERKAKRGDRREQRKERREQRKADRGD